MKIAVVGHVEWVQFARVERVPRAGEIAHASETWEEPAGGGAVAAVQLARLGAAATLFTALGTDSLGLRAWQELEVRGVRVAAGVRDEPQRRAFTFVDAAGERTIAVLGDKLVPRGSDPLPWEELAAADAAFFVSGDVEALRQARRARVLVATARELPTLRAGGVELDALVGSGSDEGERFEAADLEPPPRLAVWTEGAAGGRSEPGGRFAPAEPPGPVSDVYGCGDAFAAGLTFALAGGRSRTEALELATRCGAAALTGPGAFAGLHRA